jgi:hypothetical protein
MTTTYVERSLDLDELLYQSVVDEEFRARLLADPEAFGISAEVVLPEPVQPQDRTLLELGMSALDVYACASTCSSGPFTIVCDGTTK